MAVNLTDLAKGLFTGDVISKASSTLQESEGGILKAVEALVPTLLAGLLQKGRSSDGGGLNTLLSGAQDLLAGNAPEAMLGHAISHAGGLQQDSWMSKGLAWLQHLFGDKTNAVTDMVAGYAGIKAQSAKTLLGASVPALLGLTANQAAGSGDSIWQYLMKQKDQILGQLPGGLNIAGLLGLGSIGAASGLSSGYGHSAGDTGHSRKKSNGWLWVILLLLLALVLWYLLGQKGCNDNRTSMPVADTATIASPEDAPSRSDAGSERIGVLLPNGKELNAYKGGIEDRLVAFLMTDYMALGMDSLKKIWFDFDKLNFETGSARITEESQVQIDNLAAILNAFPGARLKIGGYTDKTGNEPVNVKLSGERAEAVRKALTEVGVGAQIEGAEGYGSQYAQYPPDAPEADRVKDRHVSVSVRG